MEWIVNYEFNYRLLRRITPVNLELFCVINNVHLFV